MKLRRSTRAQSLPIAGLVLLGSVCQLGLAATLVVPTDFATIQAAIDAANAQDVVLVEPGSYVENLNLRANVDVRGREAARTWLEPQDGQLPTVSISGADNLLFANFTLVDALVAVQVVASSSVQIASVVFDGSTAVAIAAGINSTVDVTNNVFFANATAVQRSTANIDITNNIFRSNDITITSPLGLINNNINVEANCWSNNTDLLVNGIDTSYGSGAVTGNPQFIDPSARDFHLQQGSPCIDIGVGNDIIDNTIADAGAYGGQLADASPFPVAQPTLTDSSTTAPAATNIDVSWMPNESYLVTNSVLPGGYRVYYKQNTAGPPYDGGDASGGTAPSPIDAGDTTALTLGDLNPVAAFALAPRLLTATGANESVELNWEAVLGVNGYRVGYGINSTDENEVDTGDVTRFTVTGLINGTTYRFSISALTQAIYSVTVTAVDSTQNQNESDFSVEQSIQVGPINESSRSNELTALPEFIQPFPPLPDNGGCFIATAAFGADWAAEVQALRDFRDRFLLNNAAGRWLVAQYYRLSPPLAERLQEREYLKPIVRGLLAPVVALSLFMLASSPLAKAGVVGLLLSLVILIHRRQQRARSQRVSNGS